MSTCHWLDLQTLGSQSTSYYVQKPPESFLAVSQDPSDSKSSRSHVDIFWFCFHSFEVYSIDSS